MKVSVEMPSTAGMESTANTKSVSSMHTRHSSSGVALLAPSTCHQISSMGSNASRADRPQEKKGEWSILFEGRPARGDDVSIKHACCDGTYCESQKAECEVAMSTRLKLHAVVEPPSS